jgi:predicted component of type VI protein secretion system
VSQLSQYTKMDESVIKQMIQETGVKKMAKNPLKFAKKVAEALPAMKAFEK